MTRWALLLLLAIPLLAAAACAEGSSATVQVLESEQGRVLSWEKDDLLVLVANVQPRYRAGEQIAFEITFNNQARDTTTVRYRARLLGRGGQAVAELASTTDPISSDGAVVERPALAIPASLPPGQYTLVVEIPPWRRLGLGREIGGGQVATEVTIDR